MTTIERAIVTASLMYEGLENSLGEPIMLQTSRMVSRAITEPQKIVAALHNVLTCSSYNAHDLISEGYSKEIVEAVSYLDEVLKGNYEEYKSIVRDCELARFVALILFQDRIYHNKADHRIDITKNRDIEAIRYLLI